MTVNDPLIGAALALGLAVGFVFVGELIGNAVPLLRRVSLPGAVPGGLLALACGPQVLGGALPLPPESVRGVYDTLARFPALFITVVFACLMLGRPLASAGTLWRRARPHIVMGHVIAWGQYVVGLALVLFVLAPALGVDPLAGPLIAIGFQGGHGTATGLGATFEAFGFGEGETLALAVATVGVLAGTVGGPLLAAALSQGISSDRTHEAAPTESGESDTLGECDKLENEKEGQGSGGRFSPLTGRLTLHLALLVAAIGAGALLLRGLVAIEVALRPDAQMIVTRFVPLFSVVLLAGLGMQALLQRLRCEHLFDRAVFRRVGAFALDIVIVSALATLTLSVVGRFWIAIVTLCVGGLAWNLAVFFLLGPRLYASPWPVYGLGDLGGGTATTATGLLLIRSADPHATTSARSSYADKQPFYEPIMGGGLVTALALPTVASRGPAVALVISGVVLAGWLLYAATIVRTRR